MGYVLYDCRDGVAIITLNRPEALNALSDELKVEFDKTVRQALADKDVRAIVLTGGGRAFCAGGDVKSQASRNNDAVSRRAVLQNLNELLIKLHKSPIPVISAVNGYAIGAGLGIALVGDLIVASSNAKFSAPFIKLGLVADAGVSYFSTRRIGAEKTKRILLTGEMIDAELAEKWGLVDWVVKPEEVLDYSLKLAKQLADSPKMAIEMTKSMLNNMQGLSIEAALDQELSNQVLCMLSEVHKEKVTAFVNNK